MNVRLFFPFAKPLGRSVAGLALAQQRFQGALGERGRPVALVIVIVVVRLGLLEIVRIESVLDLGAVAARAPRAR